MNKPHIIRYKDDKKETLGQFFVVGEAGQTLLSKLTLELPYKDNQHGISCVPCGTFPFKKVVVSKHIPYPHLALDVPNREGICVHAGTFASGKKVDTLGCVLVGDKLEDINHDGELDIENSRVTMKAIYDLLPENGMITISEK